MREDVYPEELFQALLTSSPIGIYIVQHGRFQIVNPRFEEITGYSSGELLETRSMNLVAPRDINTVRQGVSKALQGERIQPYEYRVVTKAGGFRWIVETVTRINYDGSPALLGNFMDITERKQAEENLGSSEEKYRRIFEAANTALAIIEPDGMISLINAEFERLFEYTREMVEGKMGWTELIFPEDIDRIAEIYKLVGKNPHISMRRHECRVVDRKGNLRNVIFNLSIIDGTERRIASLLDITDRKQMEEQLKHLSLHDPLTGLYNRAYFEEEMRRLDSGRYTPVGILVCDLDGLKLVNDTLGHKAGDEMLLNAASIIKNHFRESDVVARIGGDEFAIILPYSARTTVEKAYRRIKEMVEAYNSTRPKIPLCISIGMAISSDELMSIYDTFKEADNNMYREKLTQSHRARRAIVQTLWRALEDREYMIDRGSSYLQELVVKLAQAMGLSERSITDLRLLAQFHDIGNIGISEQIFHKPGPLTEEEQKEIQRHCEIGHRIAQSSPELVPIADWILKHHELWDGGGYPLGLKGREIPLECRVLAIASSFHAMTTERPYRKALGREEAIKELRKCAGTQFDPRVVKKFIQVLKQDAETEAGTDPPESVK
ncbi:MAG: PAS domain S-box protein [Firmicutes bacterium]|nr:PAS domain S-box protein [Bacillota bacterium]